MWPGSLNRKYPAVVSRLPCTNLAIVGFIAAARSRIQYNQYGLVLKHRCLGSSEWSALHTLWKQTLNPKLLVALDSGMKSHKKPESMVIWTVPLK